MRALPSLSIKELMGLYGEIGIELVERGVCRTSNSPVGDIAEYLLSQCFGWNLETSSKAGFDALDPATGDRIQIKCRFLRTSRSSRQAGALRNLEDNRFDWLASVVFNHRCEIELALMIPHSAVTRRARKSEHTNSHRIFLRSDWLTEPGVRNITDEVASYWMQLNEKRTPGI